MTEALRRTREAPWFAAALTCCVLWAVVFWLAPVLRYDIVTANVAIASYLALVGIGQMFPIASGGGGIDLSIPFVINFASFNAVSQISGSPFSIVETFAISIGFGALVGVVNGFVVVALRIPPIIGTLAVGFIVLTIVQLQSSASNSSSFADPVLTDFTRGTFLGVPNIFYVVLACALGAAFLLHRTRYGRNLLAVGQSPAAANLAGVGVKRTVFFAYVISGVFAGLAGTLLTGSVGSADLELGNPYLLASVGAVVLGGNLVSGGMATVAGTVLGALLLTLLVSAVTLTGIDLGFQNVARGAVITLVLLAARTDRSDGSFSRWLRTLWPAPHATRTDERS